MNLKLSRAIQNEEEAVATLAATDAAIKSVREAASLHQRIFHTKHISKPFRDALDELDLQQVGDSAYLYRCRFEVRIATKED